MKPYKIAPDLNGEDLHIGIVCARFTESITNMELEACLAELGDLGVQEENIMVVTVPGALEVGFALNEMAQTDEFDALIALGAVIRGETYHFEVVSNESAAAITRVALDTGIPIANGILTTEDEEQAQERAAQKGIDCAVVAIEMANLVGYLAPEVEADDEDDFEDEDFDDDEADEDDNK
ncbi:6,7-dimethyl-8-ribityllumazine synthase [Oligella urethralis]|uniref:6,7-dimethyl-8-ribityllumazine synthase n=1 Tax=Oligella urethralis TaxID=90245 RepID=UPI000CFE4FDA|nr:6,7-dimethyl-8-ribityllumazine synthase [Oligella urethralis]AVL71646.1 6,7-dimethyl-8-ribityllumazine synthase [Oligella urethralis]SUA66170.1 6,7-dimethyl-8-ribityllumazine synthase [Oligella urethralis]